MTEPTSDATSATQIASPPPATGNASGGATPPSRASTLEEALARIAELEHAHKNATEERDRHRKKLTTYEEAEKKAQETKLSEIELATRQKEELNEQLESLAAEVAESRVRQAVADQASKFNFTISAKTLANLLLADFDAIEFEDGHPSNIEKLLGKLAKAEPDLVKPEQASMSRQAPAIPAMNQGRSSISPPGGAIPGRIPRLEDIEWKR